MKQVRRTCSCSSCRHFEDSVQAIEAALPGLSSLGSGYAAVRSADGLCLFHDRYIAHSSECDAHSARIPPPARDAESA